MAKDILKFHAVIWPALLMSAGYEVPQGELIHGYLLMGGEKMSKTRGNVLDPFAVMEQYGIDPLRFYLFREVTLRPGRRDLARGLRAALQQRARQRARQPREPQREHDRQVPRRASCRRPSGAARWRACARRARPWSRAAGERFDALEVTPALESIWECVRRLNRLVEEEAPWKLAKDEAQAGRLDDVLHGLVAGLRLVAVACTR